MNNENLIKCANPECKKTLDRKTMQTCMFANWAYYVCDSKCMNLFYNPKPQPKPEIEASEIGKRLATVLAKNPEFEECILSELKISSFTLNRYKEASTKIPFVVMAKICQITKTNLNWMATGEHK